MINPIKAIRALLTVKSCINKIEENKMKSGIQSSEFWLNLVTIAGTLWGSLNGFIPTELSMKVIAFLVTAYTVARSIVKTAEVVVKLTATTKDDAIVAGVGSVLDKIGDTFKK